MKAVQAAKSGDYGAPPHSISFDFAHLNASVVNPMRAAPPD
jgi:hypothetical protein